MVILLWSLGFTMAASAYEAPTDIKQVLVLNSYHPEYVWGKSVIKGIRSVIDTADVELYVRYEYMDTKHHRPGQLFPLLKDIYLRKYKGFKFDVIIASDNNALNFLIFYQEELFPDTPVVFCGINGYADEMIENRNNFTGVAEDYSIQGTLSLALNIHPRTKHIAVISGTSTSSLINQARFDQEIPIYKDRVDLIDLSRLNPRQLGQRLKQLPADTIILYLSYYKMPDGTFFTVAESTAFVFEHSKLPIYSPWEYTLGHGVTGGLMLSGEKQGKAAAQYAISILKGTPAHSLPVIRNSQLAPVFDYNLLQHFNISRSSLPVNAVIKNQPQSLYYKYKYLIWAIIVFILYQSVTIFILARSLARRKRAEKLQKQLEAQLRHSQKMEAIGTFAGGIAHDLNNILGAISTCSEIALEDTPADSPAAEDIRHVLLATNRGKTLIKQVMTFSRRKRNQKRRPVQVKTIIDECINLLELVIPPSITLRVHADKNTGLVSANPAGIHQIIMNLCVNAEQAMRGCNGVLTLRLDQIKISGGLDSPVPNLKPGPYVRILVSDTGSGMDPEVLGRIFEPFYTTRTQGEGTGLGLAVTHGVVKSYGGDITVDSAVGKGTRFYVYLPCIDEGVQTAAAPTPQEPVKGRERILLVDDDRDMLYAEKKLLLRLGYCVTDFLEATEALNLFKSDPNGFDLVITDQLMPDMTGLELTREIQLQRPDMPVILCSGLTHRHSDYGMESLSKAGIFEFVRKPFNTVEISGKIRQAIERQPKKNHCI